MFFIHRVSQRSTGVGPQTNWSRTTHQCFQDIRSFTTDESSHRATCSHQYGDSCSEQNLLEQQFQINRTLCYHSEHCILKKTQFPAAAVKWHIFSLCGQTCYLFIKFIVGKSHRNVCSNMGAVHSRKPLLCKPRHNGEQKLFV